MRGVLPVCLRACEQCYGQDGRLASRTTGFGTCLDAKSDTPHTHDFADPISRNPCVKVKIKRLWQLLSAALHWHMYRQSWQALPGMCVPL